MCSSVKTSKSICRGCLSENNPDKRSHLVKPDSTRPTQGFKVSHTIYPQFYPQPFGCNTLKCALSCSPSRPNTLHVVFLSFFPPERNKNCKRIFQVFLTPNHAGFSRTCTTGRGWPPYIATAREAGSFAPPNASRDTARIFPGGLVFFGRFLTSCTN